jgi:hypothetical protein
MYKASIKLINLTHSWQNFISDTGNFYLALFNYKYTQRESTFYVIIYCYNIHNKLKGVQYIISFQCCFRILHYESKKNARIRIEWNASVLVHDDNVNLLDKNANTLKKHSNPIRHNKTLV